MDSLYVTQRYGTLENIALRDTERARTGLDVACNKCS